MEDNTVNTPTHCKLIALTFDDGPNVTITPKVLDKLEEYHVPASFFLIGQYINEKTKPIMERTLSLGCEICNHSWSHSNMIQLTEVEIKEEIKYTSEIINEMVGVTPAFFRPPYIALNDTMYDCIDLPFVNGINCTDWDNTIHAEKRAEMILNHAKDGDIILLHDTTGNTATVEALDAIIQGLLEDDFHFVTVSKLFEYKGVDPKVNYKIWTNVTESITSIQSLGLK